MMTVRRLPITGLLFFAGLFLASATYAADTARPAAEEDCENAGVDFSKDSTLTKSERLAAMDRALNKSLNSYDDCLQSPSGGGSQASGGGSGSGSTGGSAGAGTVSSAAASDISGTEKPAPQAPPASTDAETPDQDQQTAAAQPPRQAAPNGKIPDDIPSADNDTVLEKQIRQAAINETDPEKKAKLWDEYRKYKGIPKTQH